MVAALDEKLIVVPSTVMLSPFWKPFANEAEPAVPDNAVAPVMACGAACWSLTAVPLTAPALETRSGGWTALMAVVVVPPNVVEVAVPAPEEKPMAASAACTPEDVVEIEKLAALGVLIVTEPPSIDDGVAVPVIESIAESRLPTMPPVLMT